MNAETWVRYENKLNYSRNTNIAAVAGLLAGNFNFTQGFETYSLTQTTNSFSSVLTSAGFMGDGLDTETPFAYLNYILFDENKVMVDAGWKRVDDEAGFDPGQELFHQHKKLAFDEPILVPENGYIYIWVSNESEGTKVWFDDVKVTHTQIIINQASDYGVWGDVLRELKAPEFTYRHGYQGQFSEKDEETGWNHFELREYDAIIGRWTSRDPKKIGFSPYIGMYNQPTNGLDVDGGGPPTDYINSSTGDKIHVEDGLKDVVFVENERWSDLKSMANLLSDLKVNPYQTVRILDRFGIKYVYNDLISFYNQHKNKDDFGWGSRLMLSGSKVKIHPEAETSDNVYRIYFWGQKSGEKAKLHVHYTPFAEEGLSDTDRGHRGYGVYNILITPNNIYFYNKGAEKRDILGRNTFWEKTSKDYIMPKN